MEQLLPEWTALAATSARSPLEAPDWLLPLARHYLADHPVRFLTWRRAGELVGVAPLSLISNSLPLRPVRQLVPWGVAGPRLRGLVDVVARDDARIEVLDGLCEWLSGNREWDVLRLLRPQFESTTPARLRSAAVDHRWAYVGYSNLRSTTYQLDLPATTAEWDQFLRPKTRSTARREARNFGERGGQLIQAVEADAVPTALDAVERLLTERWGSKEVYFSAERDFRELIHEAIPALTARGDAWISIARDEAGIHACLVTIAQHGYAMALLVAASDADAYRGYSLGKHVFKMGIGEAVARGCHTYDFLWVGGYKESYWHAQPRLLDSAVVGRGLIGRRLAGVLARRDGATRVSEQG